MIVKESQLRKIIKEELLNELNLLDKVSNFFKRKPKSSSQAPQSGITSARLGVTSPKAKRRNQPKPADKDKKKYRHNPQLNLFFKKLESARSKIQKFQSIILTLERDEALEFDTISAESKVLTAAEGLDIFIDQVFPLISKLAGHLKENKQKDVNKIDIMVNEEMLILGLIFESEFLGVDILLNISDKDLKYYMTSFDKKDRKQKEDLIQFFVSIFRFIYRNKDSINSIIQKKLTQIKDANQKLGGKRYNVKRRTTSRNAPESSRELDFDSDELDFDSKGYQRISMSKRPEGSTDL